MKVSFEVPGEPQGKGRARGAKGRHYTPEKTVMYENWIKTCYLEQAGKHLGEAAISMAIGIYYDIPRSASKKRREDMQANRIRPTKRPDCDNVLKAVADALNGIAYKDDSQIISITLEKYYSYSPGLVITLRGAMP